MGMCPVAVSGEDIMEGTQQYLADFSLALINRTGAYYVCRDVVERPCGVQ